jgi:hypothetical protein
MDDSDPGCGVPDCGHIHHPGCGFIPTGRTCPACLKPLGPAMPEPYVYQEDFLEDDHLTCLLAGGEQTGKSTAGARKLEAIVGGFIFEYQERAAGEVAWLVADSYELTAREFQYISEGLSRHGLTVRPDKRVDPGEIDIAVPGGLFKIKTRSANDAQSLRAESPIAVLVCEAAKMSQDAYVRLRSRVARSRALFPGYGAIVLTGTFEGSLGWYPTLHTDWKSPYVQERDNVASYSIPSPANIFVYRGGFDDPEIRAMEAELGPDEFSERVLAVASPPKNRVHATFDVLTHVLPEPPEYDPRYPVWAGIDPGFSGAPSHYAVEVYQERFLPCKLKHWQGIWEFHNCGVHPSLVIEECKKQEWWGNPMLQLVIDQAGRKIGVVQGSTLTPDAEVWLKESGHMPFSQLIDIMPGIRKLDSLLNRCSDPKCGEPVLVFSPLQKGVIAELGGGPHPHDKSTHVYQWMTARDGTVTGRTPHDAWNDGVKATTYCFVRMQGFTLGPSGRQKIRVKRREEAYA